MERGSLNGKEFHQACDCAENIDVIQTEHAGEAFRPGICFNIFRLCALSTHGLHEIRGRSPYPSVDQPGVWPQPRDELGEKPF